MSEPPDGPPNITRSVSVNARINVYWLMDEQWHSGIIVSVDNFYRPVVIHYGDGYIETLYLHNELWVYDATSCVLNAHREASATSSAYGASLPSNQTVSQIPQPLLLVVSCEPISAETVYVPQQEHNAHSAPHTPSYDSYAAISRGSTDPSEMDMQITFPIMYVAEGQLANDNTELAVFCGFIRIAFDDHPQS